MPGRRRRLPLDRLLRHEPVRKALLPERVGLPEHDERWGLTLGVLLGVYVVGSFTTSSIGRAVIVALLSVLIVVIVQVEHVDRRLRLVNVAALALALLLSALHLGSDHHLVAGAQALAVAVVALSAAAAILSRIARHQLITVRTVLGALDVYVLLGLAFAAVYAAIFDVTGDFFTQVDDPELRDFFYYSAITLTTVGFGDLSPGTPVARSLTAVEALLGQIFLVTAVARFVSIMGQNRPSPPSPPTTDPGADAGTEAVQGDDEGRAQRAGG